MAILDGVEGNAHIELADENMRWSGYILIPPWTRKYAHFWSAMKSRKEVTYEGPILFLGKYYFGHGVAHIQMVKDAGPDLRVDFSGLSELRIAGPSKEKPTDFISEIGSE
jgi:hypothetical protein